MPFKSNHIYLLLEKVKCHDPPLLQSRKQEATRKTGMDWFAQHRSALNAPDANGVAILSTLFPERRTGRVYEIQSKRLENIVCRCLDWTRQKLLGLANGKKQATAILVLVQKVCKGMLMRLREMPPSPWRRWQRTTANGFPIQVFQSGSSGSGRFRKSIKAAREYLHQTALLGGKMIDPLDT